MITKKEVSEAVNYLKSSIYGQDNFCSPLYKLAELYLAGKLVEPMSKEEIEKIIKKFVEKAGGYLSFDATNFNMLAETLVGKVGKVK